MEHDAHIKVRKHWLLGRRFWLYYTVLFALCFIAAFGYLFATGHEFSYNYDAVHQHFPFFTYTGMWLRDFFQTGQLQEWNWGLGYGAGVIGALGQHLGDPFDLLSALIPTAYAETAYQLFAGLRLYLAGAAFAWFARSHKVRLGSSIIGAALYAFSGFCLFWGVLRHPHFVNAAVILPLVLLGADRVFEKKSPALFIVGIFLVFFTWFYWAYMISLFLLGYCLLRYFTMQRERGVADFLGVLGRFLGFYIIGAAMSAVLLLPIVSTVMGMGRLSTQSYVPLLFPLENFGWIIATFFTGMYIQTRGIALVAPTGLLVIVFLCTRSKKLEGKKLPVTVAFVLLALCALVPWAGHALNGMGYVTDRWAFALAFCACYMATCALDVASEPHAVDWRKAAVACGAVAALLVALFAITKGESLLACAAVLIVLFLGAWALSRKCSRRIVLCACAALCVVAAGASSLTYLKVSMHIDESTKIGALSATYKDSDAEKLVLAADDGSLGRIDQAGEIMGMSFAMQHDLPAVTWYSSIYPGDVARFQEALAFQETRDHYYSSDEQSAYVDALLSVRYMLSLAKRPETLVYGFTEKLESDANYAVFGNPEALPFAFTYDQEISTDALMQLTPLQRREALLHACVIDDVGKDTQMSSVSAHSVAFSVDTNRTDPSVELSDGKLVVGKSGAKLTLVFEGAKRAETYVYFDGFDIDAAENDVKPELFGIQVKADAIPKQYVTRYTDRRTTFAGRTSWLTNLGYSDDAQTYVTLVFDTAGTYSFNGIDVQCQPMDGFEALLTERNTGELYDIYRAKNTVYAQADLTEDKIVYFSVPYSKGWTALVDGKEVPVTRANIAFMALELPAGHHDIRLLYSTPLLREGAFVSLVGLLAFVLVCVLHHRKRKEAGE